MQTQSDEEYGQYVKPDHFSYFADVIFAKPIFQEWLDWDEKKQRFKSLKNLKKLLSWIVPEEGKEPRIGRAMDLRDVIAPVISSHPDLLKRFENDESMTIPRLNFELGKQTATGIDEWLGKIDDFNKDLKELPTIKIEQKKNAFKKSLQETLKIVKKHLYILTKL